MYSKKLEIRMNAMDSLTVREKATRQIVAVLNYNSSFPSLQLENLQLASLVANSPLMYELLRDLTESRGIKDPELQKKVSKLVFAINGVTPELVKRAEPSAR
jgi:hypothetical protein